MNYSSYLTQVQERLQEQEFALLAPPPDLSARLGLILERQESWGRLILALPGGPATPQGEEERTALAAATGAWIRNLQAHAGKPVYLILVFPFERKVADELSERIRALGQSDGEQRWGVLCWTLDLEVELVDRHSGFPRIDDKVTRALTEVPRGAAEQAWRQATAPRIGNRGPLRVDLGYVPGTRIILAVTIAFYLWSVLMGGGMGALLGGPNTRALLVWGANHRELVLLAGQQWRLLTYMLLHGGLMHLGFNMYALWNLGRHVELVYGPLRMLFIYVVGGFFGGLASGVIRPYSVTSVGASGAILGLMGALVYFGRAMPGRVDWRNLLGPVGMILLYGFFFRGIDNYAHIGGLVGGFVGGFLTSIPGQRSTWRYTAMGVAAVLILLVAAGILPVDGLGLLM